MQRGRVTHQGSSSLALSPASPAGHPGGDAVPLRPHSRHRLVLSPSSAEGWPCPAGGGRSSPKGKEEAREEGRRRRGTLGIT